MPADPRAHKIVDAMRSLLDTLSPEQREWALRELSAASIPTPRAGEVLGTIARLIPRDKQFTVAEVKARVAAEGVTATGKAIHNALGYLTRRKYLRRIGYGHYLVADGAGGTIVVVDDNDIPGIGPQECCED